MIRFPAKVQCSVCGGVGYSTWTDAASRWHGAQLRHHDPAVCARNLEIKRKQMEQEQRKQPQLCYPG